MLPPQSQWWSSSYGSSQRTAGYIVRVFRLRARSFTANSGTKAAILLKGRSSTANLRTKATFLIKGRSSTANWGTKVTVLLDMNRCGEFPLLSAICTLQCAYTGCKKFRIQTFWVCRGDKMKPFCYVTNIWQVLRFLARGPWRVWRRMVFTEVVENAVRLH